MKKASSDSDYYNQSSVYLPLPWKNEFANFAEKGTHMKDMQKIFANFIRGVLFVQAAHLSVSADSTCLNPSAPTAISDRARSRMSCVPNVGEKASLSLRNV